MTLRFLREGYQRTSGFMMLSATMFMLIISGLAVYISAEAINAGDDSGTVYYIYALTFMIGAFLTAFSLLAGVYGFFAKSEGSSVVIKIVSLFDIIISALFTGDIIYSFVKNPAMNGDLYTKVIFIISGISGFLALVYAVGAMIFSILSSMYHDRTDGKKAAKELPENFTVDRLKEIYYSIMGITGGIFALMTFSMSYYLSYQIEQFDIQQKMDVQWQAVLLDIVSKIAVFIILIMIVSSFVKLVKGNKTAGLTKTFDILSIILSVSLLLAMLLVIITLVTLIGQNCFIDSDPIYYIIFEFVLLAITLMMSRGYLKAALLSLKQN